MSLKYVRHQDHNPQYRVYWNDKEVTYPNLKWEALETRTKGMVFDPDGNLLFSLRCIGTYHIRVSILDSKDQTTQYTSDWITIYGVKQFSDMEVP